MRDAAGAIAVAIAVALLPLRVQRLRSGCRAPPQGWEAPNDREGSKLPNCAPRSGFEHLGSGEKVGTRTRDLCTSARRRLRATESAAAGEAESALQAAQVIVLLSISCPTENGFQTRSAESLPHTDGSPPCALAGVLSHGYPVAATPSMILCHCHRSVCCTLA